MGGCRCTYRTCSVRSDGKTHMFHYPVYDKVRCHQWILNSKRFEFFNLTVSQVRNKVVCQHHFTDDCFMNYKKEKLTFKAIPTENGPFCDSEKDNISNVAGDTYPSIGNIQKDFFYLDKKANSSLKYVDFLTKYDVSIKKDNLLPVENNQQPFDSEKKFDNQELNSINNETSSNLEHIQPQRTVHVHPYYDKSMSVISLKPTSNDVAGGNLAENNVSCNENQTHNIKSLCDKSIKKESKIKIISEKRISEPLPFIGKLEPVSPSLILRVPRRKNEIELNTYLQDQGTPNKIQEYNDEIVVNVPFNVVDTQNISSGAIACSVEPNISLNTISAENVPNENSKPDVFVHAMNEDLKSNILIDDISKIEIDIDQNFCINNNNNSQIEKSQDLKSINETKKVTRNFIVLKNKSLLKNKIDPERIAAIEKKRMFNKKLRDMVESCLEKSDDRKSTNILKVKDSENFAYNVGSNASNELRTAGAQEYKTMASLEARINKMENLLAKKIELNSERILQLKKCFDKGKSVTTSTQTCPNEESYKKYLYHEISKFLSPGTSSLVYEELFINKYAQKESECEPKIKRRRRR